MRRNPTCRADPDARQALFDRERIERLVGFCFAGEARGKLPVQTACFVEREVDPVRIAGENWISSTIPFLYATFDTSVTLQTSECSNRAAPDSRTGGNGVLRPAA